jgi:hypothetical protein
VKDHKTKVRRMTQSHRSLPLHSIDAMRTATTPSNAAPSFPPRVAASKPGAPPAGQSARNRWFSAVIDAVTQFLYARRRRQHPDLASSLSENAMNIAPSVHLQMADV